GRFRLLRDQGRTGQYARGTTGRARALGHHGYDGPSRFREDAPDCPRSGGASAYRCRNGRPDRSEGDCREAPRDQLPVALGPVDGPRLSAPLPHLRPRRRSNPEEADRHAPGEFDDRQPASAGRPTARDGEMNDKVCDDSEAARLWRTSEAWTAGG